MTNEGMIFLGTIGVLWLASAIGFVIMFGKWVISNNDKKGRYHV